MDVGLTIVFLGLLVFLAHLLTIIFSRTMIPDVLFLIVVGLCLGPLLGVVTPEKLGVIGPVFTAVTLIIILFEAGLTIHLDVLRHALRRTVILTVLSFIVTMTAVGFMALALTDLSMSLSFMLGAMVGSTSPAVIVPLVRQVKMHEESRAVLYLESAISDSLSIIIVFAFLEAIKLGELRINIVAGHVVSSFLIAIVLGIICALAWSILLNRVRNLKNAIFTTPAFVFILFGIVELLGYSGYVAALAFGITLGNIELIKLSFLRRYIPQESITLNETEKVFLSEVVFLLKTFFFVYVGLSMKLVDPWFLYVAVALTIAIFVLRIPIVRLSLRKTTPKFDASLIAVMIPKGLAAAVLASIPVQQGIAEGELIQNLTYGVVLFSIILTSLLTFFLSKTKLSDLYGWILGGFGKPAGPMPETGVARGENTDSSTTE